MTILVAGGGLAGAAAAAALARTGREVTLVERTTGPTDKICGEFLSAEAATALAALGLDIARLGGAPIGRVRLVRGARSVTSVLPFTGFGLSRRVLDEALLAHAAAAGVKVLRGHAVRNAAATEAGVTLNVDGIGTLRGETLLLATGKHELRGQRRDAAAPNDLVGLKMYFRLSAAEMAALAGHVELVMFPGGYAGLQMVEGQRANLCLLVEKSRLAAVGGWDGLLAWIGEASPHLAGRLEGAAPLLDAPLSIARVPYGFVHRAPGSARIYRLGDQAGVIHSFTGDGMAMALHGAALAAGAVARGDAAAIHHRRLAAGLTGQIRRAGLIFGLASTRMTQPALFGLAGLWPGSLAFAARMTRVSHAS